MLLGPTPHERNDMRKSLKQRKFRFLTYFDKGIAREHSKMFMNNLYKIFHERNHNTKPDFVLFRMRLNREINTDSHE